MTSHRTKSVGLRPNERSNRFVAANRNAVTPESARAEEEAVWSDVGDSEARGSEDVQEDEKCRPCEESVTTEAAEEA